MSSTVYQNVPQRHGVRGIERVTEIHHTTVMHGFEMRDITADAPEAQRFPEVTDLTNFKPSWATNATSCGFGRRSITSKQAFCVRAFTASLLEASTVTPLA
jgi:hypothetical protein